MRQESPGKDDSGRVPRHRQQGVCPQHDGAGGRKIGPHGKHADLHRRAINAMQGRGPRNLRVKWVPSHKDEEHVKAGVISQEHMEGNKEGDKLATLGVQPHE
eukprot:11209364-Heterocapsa_arctica.AAC.1